MVNKNINTRFDERIKYLEKALPKLEGEINCASLVLTNIISILEIPEIEAFYFNNLVIPLAGGFGGFKSMKEWKEPCGAVCGGCAAVGIIIGGREKLKFRDHLKTYQKASRFVHYFEKEFGSVACQELCGTGFNDLNSVNEYQTN